MAIYRYQHGDRPLEGYTIQHGLGRGGFGEVYYAVSDSGREVALKAVQNYEDVELRGIKHCMNLKNPHLVSIFDIRHNDQGLPFVIMEYVDGPSLRDILDSHPEGLGPAKAAFFFREIVKGLGYLHESGVVHRDLKPHNVFYEQGVVKIGDYSLSKAISTSHRTGHTLTVGTVHYMAPEISMGRYDHTVDIYALGVILYEMLAGHPPFSGDSMGEVLMKHVAGEVDLSAIQEPFTRVIKKALQKEPHDRYQSAEEMVNDLMGNPELQHSVASLGPDTLTVIAEQAMKSARQSGSPPPLPPSEPQPTAAYYQETEKREDAYKYTIDMRRARRGLFWGGVGICLLMVLLSEARLGPVPVILTILAATAYVFHRRNRQARAAYHDRHHRQYGEAVDPIAAKQKAAPFVRQPVNEPVREPKYVGEPADLPSYSVNIDESPFSRLVSLVMSGFFFFVPIAGLQRFYVGRVGSGLVWLFTFGLLGLGQIYDTIMIALGHFKDADGKRVLNFTKDQINTIKQPVNQYSAVVRRKWTESRVGFNLGNLLFNLLGAVFLLASLFFGAVIAVDLPRALATGVFGNEIAQEIRRETQMTDWNVLVDFGLGVVTVIAGTLSSICLIVARRESSWGHMFRIPVAAAAFVASVVALGSTTGFGDRWETIARFVNDRMIGGALRNLLSHDFWPGMIMACILFVFAVFILAWPARKKQVEEIYQVPKSAPYENERQTV